MTGSNLIPIVVPIVMVIVLAVWLAMVFHADAHPEWKSHRAQPAEPGAGGEQTPTLPPVRRAA